MNPEQFLQFLTKNKNDHKALRQLQIDSRPLIRLEDDFKEISIITAVDSAYSEDNVFTACVSIKFPSLEVIEKQTNVTLAEFAYIPTYFVFREGPPILECLSKLKQNPDLLLFNAHGTIHPVGIGAASHLGLLLDKPSIGVAQKHLYGKILRSPNVVDHDFIVNNNNEKIGAVVQTRFKERPIYISPGHRISLETALKFVKKMLGADKLPKPLALAHFLANKTKADFIKNRDQKPKENSNMKK